VDYRKLLNGLVTELDANDSVMIEEHYLGRGLSVKQAKDIAAQHNLTLSDSILELFTQINGGIIQWRLAPGAEGAVQLRQDSDAENIRGLAYLYTLDELVPEWTNLQNSPFAEGLEDRDRLRSFRPFDKNVEEAFAGFMVRDGILEDEAVYLRQYHDLTRLGVDVAGYLRALVQSKAFLWWQETFAARPAGRTTEDLYFYLPRLFPNETLDAFR
jgi:hypothetical protein